MQTEPFAETALGKPFRNARNDGEIFKLLGRREAGSKADGNSVDVTGRA